MDYDMYSLLGVEPSSPHAEIKAVYRTSPAAPPPGRLPALLLRHLVVLIPPCPALAHHTRASYRSLTTTRGDDRMRPQARRESTGVSVGFRAPHFELTEPLTGKTWTLDDFEGTPALLIMFICNHRPFVKHLKKDIANITSFYMEKGLAFIVISSNSVVTHPQDGPYHMARAAEMFNYSFPYVYDEDELKRNKIKKIQKLIKLNKQRG